MSAKQFDQTFLKFVAKRFDQTFLKFEMKKIISGTLVVVLLALCTLLVAMPAIASATDYPFNITDSAGREVTIQMPITRIIVLNTDVAEAVKVLGGVDGIVGVVDEVRTKSYYFPEADNIRSVGKWGAIDIEAITNIARNETDDIVPDILVLAYPGSYWSSGTEDILERGLKDFPNITVVGFWFTKQATMCEEIEKLGKILDRESEAQDFIGWREGKEKAVADGIAEIKLEMKGELNDAILSYLRATYLGDAVEHLELNELRRNAWTTAYGPKVFIEDKFVGLGEIRSRGPGSGDHDTCTMAGGYNIASDLGMMYPRVDWEFVLNKNPDVIIRNERPPSRQGWWDDVSTARGIVDDIKSRQAAESIYAVRDNRVYVICTEPLYGLDNIAGLVYWAKIIYPELNLDPKAVYTEYLTQFMGISYPEGKVLVYPPLGS